MEDINPSLDNPSLDPSLFNSPLGTTGDAPDRFEEFAELFVNGINVFVSALEATGEDTGRLFDVVTAFNTGLKAIRESHRQEAFDFQLRQGEVIAKLIANLVPEDMINELVFGAKDKKTDSAVDIVASKFYEALPSLVSTLIRGWSSPSMQPFENASAIPPMDGLISVFGSPDDTIGMPIYYSPSDTIANLTNTVLSGLKLPREDWSSFHLVEKNNSDVILHDHILVKDVTGPLLCWMNK